MVFGDMNGDGRKDAVVLYTLEGEGGANNWEQFVAVFLAAGDGSYKFQTRRLVGGKGMCSVEIRSVVNREVRLKTKEYLPDDPDCCPSRRGSAALRLAGKRLLESSSPRHLDRLPAVRPSQFLRALVVPEEPGRPVIVSSIVS